MDGRQCPAIIMTEEDIEKFMAYDDTASPVIDLLVSRFSEDELRMSGNTSIFLGTKLYNLINTFSPFYKEMCNKYSLELKYTPEMSFGGYVPYCSAFLTAGIFEDVLDCMLRFDDLYGDYCDEITSNLVNEVVILEISKRVVDSDSLKWLLEFYYDFLTTIDSIISYDYKVANWVAEQEWELLANHLNDYVDKLKKVHLSLDSRHFTPEEVANAVRTTYDA